MPEDLDKILKDIEADKQTRLHEEDMAQKLLQVDDKTADRILEERRNKVSGFKLQIDLDEEASASTSEWKKNTSPLEDNTGIPAAEPVEDSAPVSEPVENPTPVNNVLAATPVERADENTELGNEDVDKAHHKNVEPRSRTAWGCARGIIYAVLVLAVSGLLAYFVIAGGLDMTGLNKSDTKVPVTLTAEQCKSTAEVARVLKKAGVIDQSLIFQIYCKFTNADGKFQPQEEASLSPDMGYETIINILKSTVREVVKLTFPEGSTIDEIAKKLEENKVCSASDFYGAMEKGNLNYDFLSEIPVDAAHKGRFNLLEGYIFPDTYDFYVGSSGETALRKFLDAFNSRIDATMRAKIKAKGMTLNNVITLASIIQWEAAKTDDMYRVSRVLHNRLNNTGSYPKLECDSTRRYINSIQPPVGDQVVQNLDYDTYKRNGLPVGAINNPGLEAIDAAIDPSDESMVKGRYFFATDLKTGNTYYSITLKEHEAKCRKYGIGMYAK